MNLNTLCDPQSIEIVPDCVAIVCLDVNLPSNLSCVTLSFTIDAVTTASDANWSAPTASSAIIACSTASFAIVTAPVFAIVTSPLSAAAVNPVPSPINICWSVTAFADNVPLEFASLTITVFAAWSAIKLNAGLNAVPVVKSLSAVPRPYISANIAATFVANALRLSPVPSSALLPILMSIDAIFFKLLFDLFLLLLNLR